MDATVMWESLQWPGAEHLVIETEAGAIIADGVVIALDGRPLRLHYRLSCDPDWTTRRLVIQDAVAEELIFESDGAGSWTDGSGRAFDALAGCIDVDIAATPFTNTLPIRRLRLQPGEARDLRMLYVMVPELTVRAADQRYTCLELTDAGGVYRYESGSFQADLRVDPDGLVVDYPGLWRRLCP